jgi:hypothetical protein
VLAFAGVALPPWLLVAWAMPERRALAPLLEEHDVAFGWPLRALFAETVLLGLAVALASLVLVGAVLVARRRGVARALLVSATLGALGLALVVGLGVREARALTIGEGRVACECPESLASVERSVCACVDERVVAQVSVGSGAASTFEHDASDRVVAFRLHADGLASPPVRTCRLDPPKPLDELASATLHCTAHDVPR